MAGLLLASALEQPEILAIRCEPVPGGAVLKVLATAALGSAQTERTAEGFTFAIPAVTPAQGLSLPEPVAPIRSIQLETLASGARLRVTVASGTTLESRSEGSLLTIVFESEQPSRKRDVESLYPLLFPPAPTAEAPGTSEAFLDEAAKESGWTLGPLFLSPGLVLRYVDGESTFLDTPRPVQARYLEIHPRLGIAPASSVLGGELSLSYEPRIRTGADGIPILSQPSHFLTAGFERPLGVAWRVAIADQFHRGTIETQVVDPGREYFYDLTRFKRNHASVSLRTDTESQLDFGLSGSLTTESVDANGGYFSNERREANASLRYEIGLASRLTLGYFFEHVPQPETRPFVEMRAHTLSAGIEGDLTPTLRGTASLGYRREEHPSAPLAGRAFRGLTYSGQLRRDSPSNAVLTLLASRTTHLSAFEQNAFYVANAVGSSLTLPLPWALQLIGGAYYHRNSYRLEAAGLSEPRHDRLFGWTAGLGRSLTRWSYLRADYNWDDRRSNVPGLSARTHAFVVQLGLGAASLR